jgi:hypothetical protein
MHFMNSHLGGDSVSWTGHLSGVLNCDGVLATHIPSDEYEFPVTQFELLGPTGQPPLRYIRTVSAGKFDSGRWEFEQIGEAQPFEEPEPYSAKRTRDRFTREMLLRYLRALGIDPDRESFYRDGIVVEQVSPRKGRQSSIAETRREYGIGTHAK